MYKFIKLYIKNLIDVLKDREIVNFKAFKNDYKGLLWYIFAPEPTISEIKETKINF